MNTPLNHLAEMSIRGQAALRQAGYVSLEDAGVKSDEDLLALPGFGPSSLERLRAWQAGGTGEEKLQGGVFPRTMTQEILAREILLILVRENRKAATDYSVQAKALAGEFYK